MNDEEQKNLWQGLKSLWQEQKPSGEPALTGRPRASDACVDAVRRQH